MKTLWRVAAAACLVPLWIAARRSSWLDPLSPTLQANLPRALFLLFLSVVLLEAWRLGRGSLTQALSSRRRRTAFISTGLVLFAAQWALQGAITRTTGAETQITSEYGPLGAWPLLQITLPGPWVLHVGTGYALLALVTAMLAAGASIIALDRRRSLCTSAGGVPAVFSSAACPACLPPAFSLITAGGLSGAFSRFVDPIDPASGSLVVAGPVLGLAALHFALPRPRASQTAHDHGHPFRVHTAPFAVLSAGILPSLLLFGLPRGDSVQQDLIWSVFLVALIAAVVVIIVVYAWLLINVTRYRDRGERHEEQEGPEPSAKARTLMITGFLVVPAGIVLGVGLYSDAVLQDMDDSGPATFEVDVIAGQFRWEFYYPDGNMTQDTFFIPEGEVVQVNIRTKDVIHSLFIPDLGVKIDAMPGTVNEYVFEPTRTGTFQGYCAEFCGTGHAEMLLVVNVFDPQEFEPPFEHPTGGEGDGGDEGAGP